MLLKSLFPECENRTKKKTKKIFTLGQHTCSFSEEQDGMLEIQRVEISSFLQRPPLHFHKSISFLVWLVGTFIWTARLSLVYLLYFWHSWLLDEIAPWVKLPCSCNFFNTAPVVWCGHSLGIICMVKTSYPIPRLSWQLQDLFLATVP